MEDKTKSMKRLEEQVKRVYPLEVGDESSPEINQNDLQATQDASYIGSMVGPEEGYPTGMRRRVMEVPLGSKMGYHELGDEKEEADVDWMLGEASQLSGAGSRGSRNWMLAIMLPVGMVVAIVCLHQWWWEVKKGVSDAINKVGDVFDRRALEELQSEGAGGKQETRFTEKVVYSVNLDKTEVR